MTLAVRAIHSVVSLRATYGGPARSVPTLCDALAARGIQTQLLTIENETPQHALVLPQDRRVRVTLVPGFTDGNGVVLWSRAYRAAVEQAMETMTSAGAMPILHDHGMWRATNRAMAAVARARDVPLVSSTRGMAMSWSLAHHGLRKRVALALHARRDLATARVLHATSSQEATQLRQLGLQNPIAVIPNGIDLPARVAPPDPARGYRQLLFLGRLSPVKGLVPLIDAWSAARLPGWRLVIAGPDEGGHRAIIDDAIRRAHVGSSVSLVGPVSDAEKWTRLAESDALVLPSLNESFGLVVAEALAAARPVMATDGTPWESVVAADCGWHVRAPEGLVSALRDLASASDDRRAAMGARGRAMAEARFAWPQVAAQVHALYTWALGGGSRPDAVLTT